ncbi:hypothetical protein [Kitasatospora sp. NPDC091207]|uniref:hypothetical protein n=1 Tax=Kitasatospora sp. NPDC091207 TaxID=3364083 RepID=UPI003830D950
MTDSTPSRDTLTGSRPPLDLTVVVLDQEAFTQRPGADQAELSALTGRLTDEALSRAGLEAVRDNKLFFRDTGDGLVFGCSSDHLTGLLDRFLPELERALAHHNAAPGGAPVRMRVAVTRGPLPAEGGPGDGNGTARNEAHRLVDADVLKRAMEVADPNVTFLAAIVSDRVYQDVVVSRYCRLHPARFVGVVATVTGKVFRAPAWIHIPVPSAGLLTVPADAPTSSAPSEGRTPAAPQAGGPSGHQYEPWPGQGAGTAQQVYQGVAVAHHVSGDVTLSFPVVANQSERSR